MSKKHGSLAGATQLLAIKYNMPLWPASYNKIFWTQLPWFPIIQITLFQRLPRQRRWHLSQVTTICPPSDFRRLLPRQPIRQRYRLRFLYRKVSTHLQSVRHVHMHMSSGHVHGAAHQSFLMKLYRKINSQKRPVDVPFQKIQKRFSKGKHEDSCHCAWRVNTHVRCHSLLQTRCTIVCHPRERAVRVLLNIVLMFRAAAIRDIQPCRQHFL